MKRLFCLMLALSLLLPVFSVAEDTSDPIEEVIALLSVEDGAEALLGRMHPDLQSAMTVDPSDPSGPS